MENNERNAIWSCQRWKGWGKNLNLTFIQPKVAPFYWSKEEPQRQLKRSPAVGNSQASCLGHSSSFKANFAKLFKSVFYYGGNTQRNQFTLRFQNYYFWITISFTFQDCFCNQKKKKQKQNSKNNPTSLWVGGIYIMGKFYLSIELHRVWRTCFENL